MNFSIIESSLTPLNSVERSISIAINELIEIATERAELEPDASEDCFALCKKSMKGYADSSNKIKQFKEAFNELRTAKNEEELESDLKQNLKDLYEEKCQNSGPPESQAGYRAMIAAIAEVRFPDGNIPSQITVKEGEDLVLTQAITIPLDPITKQEISDPVRSRSCHHVYDRVPIADYIKSRRGRAKCPMVGCGKPLNEALLEVDDEMLLLINRRRREKNCIT